MIRQIALKFLRIPKIDQKRFFLTKAYQCQESWDLRLSTPILTKVKLNDLYNLLDQTYSSKNTISAIDVDIYANAIKDSTYLGELVELLYKLRMSADTCNTLDSTHHATIRNLLAFGDINELLIILRDPLNYGIFLDTFTSNMLLDKLLTDQEFEKAALVASLVMLQEDYSNDITCTLSQYACYKYILGYERPTEKPVDESIKVEEIKVRIKYLRNPYFDDHFDIRDPYLLAGKSLAWISERENDDINMQLQLIGWLVYQKYEKLFSLSKEISELGSALVYPEVLQLIQREISKQEISQDNKNILENSFSLLDKINKSDVTLEEPLKIRIENAINKMQKHDIDAQDKLFKSWIEIREMKLKEQIDRLDRAKRVQTLEEKQKKLSEEEQKLWFFENEEKIDLTIEHKGYKNIGDTGKVAKSQKNDEDYVPPEIVPKRNY